MQFRPQSGQSAGRERTEEQGEGRHPNLKPLQLPWPWTATHSRKPRQGFLPLSMQGWDPQLPRDWVLEARAMPNTNALPHSELWVRRLGCREICPGATQRNPLPKVPCMVQEQTGPHNYDRPFGSKCERRAIVRVRRKPGRQHFRVPHTADQQDPGGSTAQEIKAPGHEQGWLERQP